MIEFDPNTFVTHFKKNQSNIYSFQTFQRLNTDSLNNSSKKLALKDLLSKLSAGESAEGEIGKKLTQLTDDTTDKESLSLYISEEDRHGLEFSWVAEQCGVSLDPNLGKQAVLTAKLLNFGNLTDICNLILAAEVVTVVIYREVGRLSAIPLLKQVMDEVVRDEAGHLRYHGARLKPILAKAGIWHRIRFKLVHMIGLFIIVLSARLLLSKDIYILTGLTWKQMMTIIEKDYKRFYKDELALLRADFLLKLFKFL